MNTEVVCIVALILCINTDATEVECTLLPEKGPCGGQFEHFYYNVTARKCRAFIYGGCGGNSNNFRTLQECCDYCPARNSLCIRDRVYDYNYYIKASKYKISKAMNTEVVCIVMLILCINANATKRPMDCHFQPDPGPCRASMHRYYYNLSNSKCEVFIYGGCDGNSNNFETLQDCCDFCFPSNSFCFRGTIIDYV
ncbi:boophilin-H2-like [Centruroides vittatus]|uniref:boophilin-H2-like n=1 Tax=Centruroides vittatus TaxID=120091 RepID=UPI00350F47A9